MDGIIFDVDGTLWDSTDLVAESWNMVIAQHSDLNMKVTGNQLKQVFGKTMDELFDAVFPSLSKEEQMALGERCLAYENEWLAKKPAPLFDGVFETFETLAKHTSLYIVSNCQSGYVDVLLHTTGLAPFVKDHLCFGQTQVSKDQTIRMLMEKNNLKDVVYVGDTLGDFRACKAAGIPFIYAKYGFGNVPDAAHSIDSIRELCTWDFGM